MAEIVRDGGRLSFDVHGAGNRPTLVLLSSLGTTTELWTDQVQLANAYRLVCLDTRGHGHSDTPPGPYTLEQLGRDVIAVLDDLGCTRAHVCGISLGGMVALWLAIHTPHRVNRIIAANTGARVGSTELWAQRITDVHTRGLPALASDSVTRWFTEQFRMTHPAVVEQYRHMLGCGSATGYVGCCAALRDADLGDDLHRIVAPTLVITGTADVATPPAVGELVSLRVPDARLLSLEAAHLSNVEQPDRFTSGVRDFLQSATYG
ncbi:MAG: 3-oxoadipate enol-lactonase [Acidobacteriota bacterium]|nr:3-oxoadipate enol-lactonase [Acidobacteriota bacterium]